MNIEIKKLTPEIALDYLHFFDTTPHDDFVDENKCYCVCWSSADHRIETDFSTVDKRRELAYQYVNSGILQGYLAYHGDRVVGWCNANTKSNCQNCISWLRFMQSIDKDESNLKVKSVFCFVIAPEMQRQGIASKLLERVCADAEIDGFDIVESYPKKEFSSVATDFMGPAAMYERLGFTVYKEINNEVIMRKSLRIAHL
jgi:GNAT superfamily N-acetyltransferase